MCCVICYAIDGNRPLASTTNIVSDTMSDMCAIFPIEPNNYEVIANYSNKTLRLKTKSIYDKAVFITYLHSVSPTTTLWQGSVNVNGTFVVNNLNKYKFIVATLANQDNNTWPVMCLSQEFNDDNKNKNTNYYMYGWANLIISTTYSIVISVRFDVGEDGKTVLFNAGSYVKQFYKSNNSIDNVSNIRVTKIIGYI